MSNIIGLCLDDVIEEIKTYTDEGVSRSEAIEYVAFKSGISPQEHEVRIKTVTAILSVKHHQDLGHLLESETNHERARYTGQR